VWAGALDSRLEVLQHFRVELLEDWGAEEAGSLSALREVSRSVRRLRMLRKLWRTEGRCECLTPGSGASDAGVFGDGDKEEEEASGMLSTLEMGAAAAGEEEALEVAL